MLSGIKNVLIGVAYDITEEDKPSSALSYGLGLARTAEARITALSAAVRVNVPRTVLPSLTGNLAGQENRRLDALARAAGEQATRFAQAEGLVCTSEHKQLSYNDLVDAFTARARVNDLAILDAEHMPLSADRGLIEAALFHSGRPAIVVPFAVTDFKADSILIAWDGSARAARAVHDALPFLQEATRVEIVSIEGEKDIRDAVPGSDLAFYLSCHDVCATTTTLQAEDGDAVGRLRQYALEERFDLIVMGAFVRSWLRQITLGGFTRSLLDECSVPILLSH